MNAAFKEVIEIRDEGLPGDGEVEITGADPVFSTRFKIGETCASVLAGIGVAVSDIWALKTGRRQSAAIDARSAAATMRSTRYMQRPGADGAFALVVNENHEAMIKITQPWPTKDGRWFLPHFGLPNLQKRVLGVLGCEPNPKPVSKAVAQWDALDLEAAIDEARACGAMVRSNAEWLGPSARQGPGSEADRRDHQDRGQRPGTTPRRRPAVERHSRPRPDAHPRWAYRGADAGGKRRGRADGDGRTSATDQGTRHGYEPWQAKLLSQPQDRRRRRAAQGTRAWRRRLVPGLPSRHVERPRLRPRGFGGNSPRHCLSLDKLFRYRRPVQPSRRLGAGRPDRYRHLQGRWRRPARAVAGDGV